MGFFPLEALAVLVIACLSFVVVCCLFFVLGCVVFLSLNVVFCCQNEKKNEMKLRPKRPK